MTSNVLLDEPESPSVASAGPHLVSVHRDDHMVQFYQTDEFLGETVTRFLAIGLSEGEPVVVIATANHWAAFRSRLALQGHDVDAAIATGRLTALDARETLSKFMANGRPDADLFRKIIGGLLEPHAKAKRVRAYGEMVDLLWTEGNPKGAIALEEMWNDLQRVHRFTLLCSYLMGNFYKEATGLHDVCATHAHVLPVEEDAELTERSNVGVAKPPADDAAAEIAHRKNVEKALRDSLRELRRAESELRESQEELKDFVDNAAMPLHWVGRDGAVLWANRAELELLGYERDEYVGRPITAFHADRHVIEDILSRLERGETLREYEARLRAKDGSIRHVLITSNVYRQNGQFRHTRCFTQDITARRQLEITREAANRRTARLVKITAAMADAVTPDQVFEALVDQVAAALDASSASLWILDPRDHKADLLRSVGFNDAARKTLRSVPLDVAPSIPVIDTIRTGRPMWIASKQDLLEQYPHLAPLVATNRSYRIASLPVVVQGRTLGALAFTFDDAPPIDEDERTFLMLVARYSGQALERLRLLETEKKNRSQAELLYGLVGGVVDAQEMGEVFDGVLGTIGRALQTERSSILTFDASGAMRFKAWRGLSDAYRREVDGHSPWSRDTKSPKPIWVRDVDTDPSMAAYLPVFRQEGIRALAFIPLVASGQLIGKFMVYYAEPHDFSAEESEMARAIANHVASAIARFAAVDELRQSVRFNEMFTAILGHDLRNPLAAIMAAAQTAARRSDNERVAIPLTRVIHSGHRMARMIDQLLDFTRARVGAGIPVDLKPVNLAPLVRQIVGELKDANPAWEVRVHHAGDTGGVWDEDRLCQVLSNLIGNAVQHGNPEHGVSVRVDGTAGDCVRVEVHNMGTVPSELLPKLFDPMTGGDQRRERSNGLGLGLFITKEIVKAHGGNVDVRSAEQAGTTFVVSLPRLPSVPENIA